MHVFKSDAIGFTTLLMSLSFLGPLFCLNSQVGDTDVRCLTFEHYSFLQMLLSFLYLFIFYFCSPSQKLIWNENRWS
jgi:hypothetical protein